MILLVTATVRPYRTGGQKIDNEKFRISEYRTALAGWAQIAGRLGARMIVVENSLADQSEVVEAGKVVDTFSWLQAPPPSPQSQQRGKGHMEAQMLAWSLPKIEAGPHELVWKITGRTLLHNWQILRERPTPRTIIADLPRTHTDWVPTRVFGATYDLWPALADKLLADSDDSLPGKNIENVLAEVCRSKLPTGRVLTFRSQPRFAGTSGETGKSLDTARRPPHQWLLSIGYRAISRVNQSRRRMQR